MNKYKVLYSTYPMDGSVPKEKIEFVEAKEAVFASVGYICFYDDSGLVLALSGVTRVERIND